MRSRWIGLLLVVACGVSEAAKPEPSVAPAEVPTVSAVAPAAAEPAADATVEESTVAAASGDVGPAAAGMPSPIVAVAGGADAAVFGRADARRRAGDLQGMRQAFLELVRDHPTSPFVPHAFFAFGEISFAQGRMDEAKRFFEKAGTFATSDVAPFARHRVAWCEVNLGEDQAALNSFIQAARAALRLGSEQGKRLVSVSIFDSTAVFARTGKLDRAAQFYKAVVGDTDVALEPVLTRMADAAVDAGRADELARVCKDAGSPRWCADAVKQP